MSSRALRKAQRQREEDNNKLERKYIRIEEEISEDDRTVRTKPNPFAMLDEDNTDSEEDTQQEHEGNLLERETAEEESTPKASASKSKKKKKKKGKDKAVTTSTTTGDEFDEIDKALHSLDLATPTTAGPSNQAGAHSELGRNSERLCNILAIVTQNLNASNEMRRLFGRVAVTTETEDQRPAGGGRRRGRGAGLAGVLAGQQHPGSRGVLGHRKNVFIQGKDTWPQATAGGLGMKAVEKRTDGTVLYSFVHNAAYQDVQRQFYICVASFDPERMVQLLVHNPYHIMTLLQVHEIAIAESDYSTAGELLERALFSFGRSVHSTFSAALTQGKARLDFCRRENRELWLAGWKYIKNLGRRGTWRTAFEWAKLLLSLSPLDDPYCVGLIIDQLALRAKVWEDLLNLAKDPTLSEQWSKYPNTSFSIALTHDKLGQPDLARSSLAKAISNFPWVIPRIFQELNIDRIPPKLWGSVPPTVLQQLLTEMYAVRSKDIWNTPEATSLLVEVANRVSNFAAAPHWDPFVSLSQARHVILDDTPQFLSLLPKHFTDPATSPFDPLPPAGDIQSSGSLYSDGIDEEFAENDSGLRRELWNLIFFFSSLGFGGTQLLPDAIRQRVESRLDELVSVAGVDEATLQSRLAQLEDLSNQRASEMQEDYVLAAEAASGEHAAFDGLTYDERTEYLNSLLVGVFVTAVVWQGADMERWEEGLDTTPFSQYASFLLKQKPEFAKMQIEAMEERFPGKGRDLLEHFIDLERPKQEES